MDRQLSSGATAAIVVVAVVVLGLIAWRMFGSSRPNEQQQQQIQGVREDYMRRMPPGQAPVGVPTGGR